MYEYKELYTIDFSNVQYYIEILGLDVVERSFGDCAGRIIETFRELKHYRNDKYSHEIQIEIVSGDIRIALE